MAHRPDVCLGLRLQSVQPLVAIGAHPTVQRAAGVDPGTAVRLLMTLPSKLADYLATFSWTKAGVRRVGDDPEAGQSDGFGGIGAHRHLL